MTDPPEMRAEDEDTLSRLARAARACRPPAIDPEALQEMTRTALLAARGRRRSRTAAIRAAVLGAGLAVAAAAVLVWVSTGEPARLESSPGLGAAEIQLPSGDRITSEAGARFAISIPEAGVRRVRLEAGEVLFDVAPLGTAERFEVITLGARLEVIGTVFAVRADGTRTRVHVFEGRVRNLRGDRAVEIGPGEQLDTAGENSWTPELRARGESAALRRAEEHARMAIARLEAREEDASAARLEARSLARESNASPAAGERERSAPRASAGDARRALERGEYERALEIVRARAPVRGEWAMLEGDALRALGRSAEAADAYDRAAASSTASPATRAGYLAAGIRLRQLDDPEGALRSLDASRADAPHSPIEDAALALRVRALIASGDRARARETARVHLARFPASAARPWMTAIADAADGE